MSEEIVSAKCETGRRSKGSRPSRFDDFIMSSTTGQRETVISVISNVTLSSDVTDDCKEYWRKHMFVPVVDLLIGELQRRFMSDESLCLSKAVSAVFELNYDGLTGLLNTYDKVINIDRHLLKAEMKTFNSTATVTNILNPEHTPVISEELKLYPNLQTVVRLALTLPVSSATCERSFSAMRRVKNYLRSTMQQDRFSALSLLNIESDIARNIDIPQLIEEFSHSSNAPRRMRLD